ncbi:MAG: ABC transporter permease DevC [Nostoc sp. DedSLP03]|uniref:ABC transporter permease DevC n=1 Tax=Nostoc sp. DedSLP03 TaxID=3075400 RepID=UPI002AD3C719|nr:ABC transporter permease DevC [Nostoc sp. DedSLP03]MDZ7963829.1 ABC transporter permease DevC [Nostoc sp. DedSLP03]
MNSFGRIPLAWLQLTRYKLRLLVAIIGIAFAAILIFMQLAFLDSLYDSQTALHTRLKADLILINPEMKTLANTRDFPRQHLYRTLNFSEVDSVNYVYHGQNSFKYGNVSGGKGIIILGINPDNSPFKIAKFNQVAHLLRTRGVILFDRNSDLKEYGNILKDLDSGKSIAAEIGNRQIWISGLVDFAGASFADDGNVITSSTTFNYLLPERSANNITIGLVNLKSGVDQKAIAKKISTQLPGNVQVMTRQEFIDYEKHYWATSAPIGFVFSTGVFVGFLVGVIIVYQILYGEVSDHLPDYAVLKARGYKHRYFLNVLFQEALILAVLGYIPGLIVSIGLYEIVKDATALPMYMTFTRALLVLLLTIIMCFTSGTITMNKLKDANPADLF